MAKLFALSLTILLALASTGGYLILDRRIAATEGRIAAGQGQLAKGRRDFAAGKARLEAGKRDAARSRQFFEFADEELDGGRDLKRAGDLIGERSDRQIAEGEKQLAAGQQRLRAGEWSIRRGSQQLKHARRGRLACAVGAAFFASLAVMLGVFWRRAPAQTSMTTDTQMALGFEPPATARSAGSKILGWLLVLVVPGLALSAYLYVSRTTRQFSEASDLAALAVAVALGLLGVLILVRRWGSRLLATIAYVVLFGTGMYVSMVGVLCAAFHDCHAYHQAFRWGRVAWRELLSVAAS